jgi:chemotaxis protein methyltransferase WspC
MLDEALRLANAAQFADAAALCERHLSEHGPSVRLFHVLGLVRDAVGDRAGAIAAYRKVLYLDPRHEETLIHLALLLEFDNQTAEAERLRARARRVAQAMEPQR